MFSTIWSPVQTTHPNGPLARTSLRRCHIETRTTWAYTDYWDQASTFQAHRDTANPRPVHLCLACHTEPHTLRRSGPAMRVRGPANKASCKHGTTPQC